jgi:hypothetical protein
VAHGFHGPIAQGERGDRVWHHDGGWPHHSYPGYYGYFGPFDYGLDAYADPYYYDNESFDAQQTSSEVAPDESASLIMSVQRELSQLGYYHGPIDGVTGSETEQAVRWFQSIDHLPVTGRLRPARHCKLCASRSAKRGRQGSAGFQSSRACFLVVDEGISALLKRRRQTPH